jgi:hypothetical protein
VQYAHVAYGVPSVSSVSSVSYPSVRHPSVSLTKESGDAGHAAGDDARGRGAEGEEEGGGGGEGGEEKEGGTERRARTGREEERGLRRVVLPHQILFF